MASSDDVRIAGVTRYEEEDFVRAHRDVPILRKAMLRGTILSIVLPAAGLVWAVAASSVAGMWFGALPMAFGALLFWRTRRLPVAGYRAMAEWQRQMRFEILDRGIRFRTERTAVELDWDHYLGWIEGPDAFYLERPNRFFEIVPKRAFARDEELETLRELFTEHVRFRPGLHQRPPLLRQSHAALLLWVVLIGLFVLVYQLVTG